GLLLYQYIHRPGNIQRVFNGVPEVLANGKGDAVTLKVDALKCGSGFKIPVLVKYIVVGQQRLIYDGFHYPVFDKISRIVQIFSLRLAIWRRQSNDTRDIRALCRYFMGRGFTESDKFIKLQKIARGITANT